MFEWASGQACVRRRDSQAWVAALHFLPHLHRCSQLATLTWCTLCLVRLCACSCAKDTHTHTAAHNDVDADRGSMPIMATLAAGAASAATAVGYERRRLPQNRVARGMKRRPARCATQVLEPGGCCASRPLFGQRIYTKHRRGTPVTSAKPFQERKRGTHTHSRSRMGRARCVHTVGAACMVAPARWEGAPPAEPRCISPHVHVKLSCGQCRVRVSTLLLSAVHWPLELGLGRARSVRAQAFLANRPPFTYPTSHPRMHPPTQLHLTPCAYVRW